RSVVTRRLGRNIRSRNQSQQSTGESIHPSIVVARNYKPARLDAGEPILRVAYRSVDLVPQPEIEHQRPPDPPVVLSVKMAPRTASVLRAARPHTGLRGGWEAQQEIGERISIPQPRRRRTVTRRERKGASRIRRLAWVELQPENIRS